MSIFYSNSLKPRGFEYINHKSGTPVELQGHFKRHNSVRGFLRSEEANESHIQRGHSRNGSRHLHDTKRTLFPDYNKENSKIHSIRITHHDTNSHPGNMSALINRTSDDSNKHESIRMSKVSHVTRETQQDLSIKRYLKPAPLKENQNTINYVPTTLAGTNLSSCQDKQSNPIIPTKHLASSNQKARYDLISGIPTLPGSFNNRDDYASRYLSARRVGEFSARNSHTSQTTTPTERPSTSRQYRNGESHATHDINPYPQPRKSSNMRERLLAQSSEEYFGIQGNQHKNKPILANNAFKSSLEFR